MEKNIFLTIKSDHSAVEFFLLDMLLILDVKVMMNNKAISFTSRKKKKR